MTLYRGANTDPGLLEKGIACPVVRPLEARTAGTPAGLAPVYEPAAWASRTRPRAAAVPNAAITIRFTRNSSPPRNSDGEVFYQRSGGDIITPIAQGLAYLGGSS